MPPRNPSELARLEEERQDLLDKLKTSSKFMCKSIKEELLRELRTIERTLGIESQSYNTDDFFRL